MQLEEIVWENHRPAIMCAVFCFSYEKQTRSWDMGLDYCREWSSAAFNKGLF